ncbi:uncharacterized protein DUF4124 [Thiogranum longum]|uniref:Uncharacterized protein DUF4124 n=1 Tax=Thiogranum longum TaxID=1537524 RepID=A0A4R1HBM2_9GAMM|nr:DUF4124 domain-containing protein [Thiogranum longum]TCK17615.1 uncharacterized protein DUF4124 [Thiogranum longum]
MIAKTLIGGILLLAMAGAQAAMYKWKDEHGNTQFGQFPPAGVEAKRMKTPHAPASSSGKSGPGLQDRVKALEEKQGQDRENAQMANQEKERAAQLKQNCDNARKTVQLLERGGNRRYRMPDGSVQRLDEKETRRRIDESKKYLKDNCS